MTRVVCVLQMVASLLGFSVYNFLAPLTTCFRNFESISILHECYFKAIYSV